MVATGRGTPPNRIGDRCIPEHDPQVPLPTQGQALGAAAAAGISRNGPPPTPDQVSTLAALGQAGLLKPKVTNEELLAPWADQIYQWLTGDRLQMTRIHE